MTDRHEARTARYAAAVASILEAAETGAEVYNVDFTDWKDDANRAFDKKGRDPLSGLMPHGDDAHEGDREVYWEMPMSLHHITSKKFVKLLDNSEQTAYVIAVRAVVAEWTPIAEAIKVIKKNVIKGRKPSTTPRTTPERTIENTGTCAVCGHNVKLAYGKIVHHGFTIRRGWREGDCFGVGFKPIEVSPEGLNAYLEVVIADLESNYVSLRHVGDIVDVAERRKTQANLESLVRFLDRTVIDLVKRVENWETKSLPGA